MKPSAPSHRRRFRVPSFGLRPSPQGFTLVEILIALSLLGLVVAAIYSSWTAILRATKVGLEAAASVQRARIAVRMLEDSLGSAHAFAANPQYYSFVAENGREASLSFVTRLAKDFPRSGKFGDFDVRRVTFSVESAPDGGQQLVLRQQPLLMEKMDVDEQEHPIVLAKNVQDFELQFYSGQSRQWLDDWVQTNQLPQLVRVTLRLSDRPYSSLIGQEITRIVNLPSIMVPPVWQVPKGLPGQQLPGQLPPGQLPPGQQIPGQQLPGQQPPGQQFPSRSPFQR